ncbi:MAG: TonB-dependent receptor domain-containing protein, partial [Thermaurantiacus sp.]
GVNTRVRVLVEHADHDLPALMFRGVIPPGPAYPQGYVQDKFVYPWSTEPRFNQALTMVMINGSHDAGAVRITANAMFRERRSRFQVDTDLVNAPLLADLRAQGIAAPFNTESDASLSGRDNSSIATQDFRLDGAVLDGMLLWLAGFEAYQVRSNSAQTVTRTPTPANPSTGIVSPTRISTDSVALFGSLILRPGGGFELAAEGRHTWDDRTFRSRRLDLRTGQPIGGPAFVVDAASETTNFSYNLVGSYQWAPGSLAFVKYGTGFRAGGFNSNLGDPRQPIPIPSAFDDETASAIEAGLKLRVEQILTLGLGAYQSRVSNQIVSRENGCFLGSPVCPVLATSFLDNAGRSRVRGVELDATLRLESVTTTAVLTVGGSYQTGKITDGPFTGFELPQLPDWLMNANFNLRQRLDDRIALTANVAFRAQWGGVQELGVQNFPFDDFQVVDARVGLDFGRVTASFFVNNVFDTSFRLFKAAVTERFNQPRLFGIQARVRY